MAYRKNRETVYKHTQSTPISNTLAPQNREQMVYSYLGGLLESFPNEPISI